MKERKFGNQKIEEKSSRTCENKARKRQKAIERKEKENK